VRLIFRGEAEALRNCKLLVMPPASQLMRSGYADAHILHNNMKVRNRRTTRLFTNFYCYVNLRLISKKIQDEGPGLKLVLIRTGRWGKLL
jgi:hypothetical protein